MMGTGGYAEPQSTTVRREGAKMTAQVHERLILEGEETSMAFCPPLPENHARIRELDSAELERASLPGILTSTACWRGYVGTWEIKGGWFYLVDIVGRYRLDGSGPILADWFTGVIRIPRGERLHYVHMGFGSVYEEELHVKIEKGEVVRSRVFDNGNREVDVSDLTWRNLPGFENRFEGDDEM
jgi:hypothetical protein